VTNGDLVSAQSVENADGSFDVVVTFTRDGAAKLLRATRTHVGRPLAILLDGQVALAPIVRSPISASARITGNYTRSEAARIASGIIGR
jgi:preprotein translocase subunit SecD